MNPEQILTMLTENGTTLALNLGAAIAILALGSWVAKLLHRMVRKGLEKAKVEPLLVKFLARMVYAVLMVFVILAAVGQLGVQTTSIIALLGAAGLAVGLALQGSLSNFAAGVLLIVFRPYRVGDYVEAGGVSGTVDEVQIFTTVLNTPDNRMVIVPNGQIIGGTITNYSANPTRRVDLTASVGYGDDSEHVRRVLEGILEADERVLKDPAPTIRMNRHGDSAIEWVVRPWVKVADYWAVYWDLTEAIKRRFDEEGISIPFPQRDVHVYHHGAQSGRTEDERAEDVLLPAG